jgi:hypothetical protein
MLLRPRGLPDAPARPWNAGTLPDGFHAGEHAPGSGLFVLDIAARAFIVSCRPS